MDLNQEKILPELLEAFSIEATERLKNLTDGMVELEKAKSPESRAALIETIFRDFHSLKGAARSIGRTDIERICQSAESVFSLLKRNELVVSRQLAETLFSSIDFIIELIQTDTPELIEKLIPKSISISDALKFSTTGISKQVETPLPIQQQEIPEKKEQFTSTADANSTVRLSLAELDLLMNQIEELRNIKLMAHQQAMDLSDLSKELSAHQKELRKQQRYVRLTRQSLKKQDSGNESEKKNLAKVSEKLISAYEHNSLLLKSVTYKIGTLAHFAGFHSQTVESQAEHLFLDIKKLLMLPFARAVAGFQKIVRDLAHGQKKQIELHIEGEDIVLDRRILDALKDPLIHLIRNCIDHGIESPAERERKNKSPNALISVSAVQTNNQFVEIRIGDDGSGVDLIKLRNTIKKSNLLPPDEVDALTEMEVLPYMFHSGISTKSIITDLSGRGLGLAIVREKIEKAGGTVSFETVKDKGTVFILTLPTNFAAFRGVLIRIVEQLFVVPSANVERVMIIKKESIVTLENRDAIEIDGEMVSLADLGEVLGMQQIKELNEETKSCSVFVLKSAGIRIAFLVDEIIEEQELTVKNLGRQLLSVKNTGGATILGNGKLVLILDASNLLHSTVDRTLSSIQKRLTTATPGKQSKKRLLVVDDSITSRLLIKSILDGAGYDVKTAVDGLDAFEQLLVGQFDLLISDVDMPRMSGFTLTEKIRNDKRFSELPVILVTSLETPEDRERGIDVGASAYIIKKSFDQSNLLEIVERLV